MKYLYMFFYHAELLCKYKEKNPSKKRVTYEKKLSESNDVVFLFIFE